jgi:hypothetical protein
MSSFFFCCVCFCCWLTRDKLNYFIVILVEKDIHINLCVYGQYILTFVSQKYKFGPIQFSRSFRRFLSLSKLSISLSIRWQILMSQKQRGILCCSAKMESFVEFPESWRTFPFKLEDGNILLSFGNILNGFEKSMKTIKIQINFDLINTSLL